MQHDFKNNTTLNLSFILQLTDEEIMLKVSQGQIDQLGILFERYHKKAYNFYVNHNTDLDTSNDLTQITFERILKYKHSYKEEANFKAWFYQIVRNVLHDHYRKNKMPTNSIDEIPTEKNMRFADNSVPDIEKQEKYDLLYKAINKLPPDKKEIIILSQIEEMEYKFIAETLQITENLARVRVHRALQSLKEIMHSFIGISNQ